MPRTILRLTDEDRETLALLGMPFHELSFLQEAGSQELVKRAGIAKKATPTVRRNRHFLECIRNQHKAEPCLVLDVIQAKGYWDFHKRITGDGFREASIEQIPYHSLWKNFYEPQFRLWQDDFRLVGFGDFKRWPQHLAGWHHLKKYGQNGLLNLDFDRASMGRALLYEILHEQNITTLTDLAAIPLNELYAHMKASKFSDVDEQLRDVQDFLRGFYVRIETVMEE